MAILKYKDPVKGTFKDLPFVIAKGEQGPPGPQGPKGDPGKDGVLKVESVSSLPTNPKSDTIYLIRE